MTDLGMIHMHTRAVLILLIQLSAMTKLKRESDHNISWNEMRRRISLISIYTYKSVGRDTDVTVNEQEDTSMKLIRKFWFRERVSKRCSSDKVVARETYNRDRHHVITKTISLRRRDIQTMNYNRIMYRTENPSLTILDGVESLKWVRTMSSE